ncbi:MAG TPA: hypothetical protein VGB66_07990 [Longimicrobium sp.]
MRHTRSVAEIACNFTEYVDRVEGGESFVLVRNGRAVAEMGSVRSAIRLADLPDLLASLPRLTPEEASAFEHDLAAARHASLNPTA